MGVGGTADPPIPPVPPEPHGAYGAVSAGGGGGQMNRASAVGNGGSARRIGGGSRAARAREKRSCRPPKEARGQGSIAIGEPSALRSGFGMLPETRPLTPARSPRSFSKRKVRPSRSATSGRDRCSSDMSRIRMRMGRAGYVHCRKMIDRGWSRKRLPVSGMESGFVPSDGCEVYHARSSAANRASNISSSCAA